MDGVLSVECPHCQQRIDDLWEYDFDGREATEIECPACDAPLILSVHTSYTVRAAAPAAGAP